jgi:signal transduction histidine kinase
MIQVLTNLIANALKFTPEIGGRINVHVKDLDKEAGVYVEDNGRGIAANDIDKVFDRFVQVEKQTGPGEHGTGLGLAIVKELMEMHGGRVWATSTEEGTNFCIALPKYDRQESTEPEVSENPKVIIG